MYLFKKKRVVKRRIRKFRRRKKPLYKKKSFWEILMILVFLGVLSWAIIFGSWFQVKYFKVKGLKTIRQGRFIAFCQKNIRQKIFFLKTESLFALPLKNLSLRILKQFPQIKEIQIKRHLPNSLYFFIEERKPVANFFCHKKNFFMDDTGVIFSQARDSALPTVEKAGIDQCKVGDKVFNSQEIREILLLLKKFYSGAKIEKIKIYPLRAEVIVKSGWKVIFSLQGERANLSTQIEKLNVLINKVITPEKLKRLDYIDMRLENIFYKFK